MVKDTEVNRKIATPRGKGGHGRLRGGWDWKRPRSLDSGGTTRSPLLRVCGAQHEGTWTGQVQAERTGIQVQQESQGTAEDGESATPIQRVQIAARRVLGLLGKGNNHANDHRECKVYEADKKAYFAAHREKKPNKQRIADWKAKG